MNSGISYTNAVASTSTAFCPPSRRLPSSSAAPLPGALDSLPSSTDVAATSQLSSASQSLARAKDVVAALLTAADSRPSRRKVPGAAPGVGACDPCRRVRGSRQLAKLKLMGGADQIKVRWGERSHLWQVQGERRRLLVLGLREAGEEEGTDQVRAKRVLRGRS